MDACIVESKQFSESVGEYLHSLYPLTAADAAKTYNKVKLKEYQLLSPQEKEEYKRSVAEQSRVTLLALRRKEELYPVEMALARVGSLWDELEKRFLKEGISEGFICDRKRLKEVERNLQARMLQRFPDFSSILVEYKNRNNYSYKKFN